MVSTSFISFDCSLATPHLQLHIQAGHSFLGSTSTLLGGKSCFIETLFACASFARISFMLTILLPSFKLLDELAIEEVFPTDKTPPVVIGILKFC